MLRSILLRAVTASSIVLVCACSDAPEAASELDAFRLSVGDCFNDDLLSGSEVSGVPGVPCEQPHDNQVYALFDLAAEEFPGENTVLGLANEGCLQRFPAAIGTSYEASALAFTTLTPTERSWTELADREVVCIAYHMELEKLRGTVLGSGR